MSRRLLAVTAAALCLSASAATGTHAADLTPSSHRVVGGSPASPGEYPWMAALYNGSPSSGQFCGGALVKPTVVVTAAHCASAIFPGTTRVLLGRNTLSGSGGEQIVVLTETLHPRFNATGRLDNDIAILRLERPSVQQPITTVAPGLEAYWRPGVMATITGWGDTSEGGSGSDALLEAQVPIISDTACLSAYGSNLEPASQVCAGYLGVGGVDTCQGDSGGPLMVPGPAGALTLAGLTSWGFGCARAQYPGVYTEIGSPVVYAFLAAAAAV